MSMFPAARRRVALSLAAGLMAPGIVLAGTAFNAAPPPNMLQKKYYTYENQAGGLKCSPKGKLKELVGEPNRCYLDLDDCKAGRDAVGGTLDGSYEDLFADLVTLNPAKDKLDFQAACPGGDGPQFLEGLGIQGLGYMHSQKHAALLAELASETRIKQFSGASQRATLVTALWGAGDKASAVPALKRLVEADAKTKSFKALALMALQRWNSDAGVPFCTSALSSERDEHLLHACMDYLGRMKVKAAKPQLIRLMDKNAEEVSRALGLMGDGSAKATLTAWLEEKDTQNPMFKVAAWVALANLGDKAAMKAITTILDGTRPMNKKEQAKAKKSKKPVKAKEADDKLMQATIMETLNLDDAAFKAVSGRLQKLTKEGHAKKWKVALYANAALAQRGDQAAINKMVSELENPKDDIRKAALDVVGGLDAAPGSNFMNRGLGVVRSPMIADAALKFYDAESNKGLKLKALHAAFAARSAVANMK